MSVARKLMDRQEVEWDLLMENAALRAKNDALQAAVVEATTRRRRRKPADAPAPSGRPRVLTDAVLREHLRQTSGRKLSVQQRVERLKHQGIIVDRTTLQKALQKAGVQPLAAHPPRAVDL